MTRISAKVPDEMRFRQTDTPASRTQKLEILRRWIADAIESIDIPDITNIFNLFAPILMPIDEVPDAAYTIKRADNYRHKVMTSAVAVTITVPLNTSDAVDIGCRVRFTQEGVGKLTFVPEGAVIVQSDSGLKSYAQYSVVEIQKIRADTWTLFGSTDV